MKKTVKFNVELNFEEVCMLQEALQFYLYHNDDDLGEEEGTSLMDLGEKLEDLMSPYPFDYLIVQ